MTPTAKPKPVFVSQEPAKEPVKEVKSPTRFLESLLPVFTALAAILAVKVFLLFAIIGAFVLAQAALPDQTYHGMWVLISYCALTILPLVWLDVCGKKGS